MKPVIVSHRYLTRGKAVPDNLFSQLEAAIAEGFRFFETDIRRLPGGQFYISHDPQDSITEENDAKRHLNLWRKEDLQIALNIKELGHEKELLKFLEDLGVVSRVFLFDFDIEFLGADPQQYINLIHSLNPALRCAVRVSDHNQPIGRAIAIKGSDIIWLDEFDGLWVKEPDIKALKDAGKTVYCIAPDLHGLSHEKLAQRFHDFMAWGADGICTDYAVELREILKQNL